MFFTYIFAKFWSTNEFIFNCPYIYVLDSSLLISKRPGLGLPGPVFGLPGSGLGLPGPG